MKYVLFIITFLFYNYSFSQECSYEKDTLYFIIVEANPINHDSKIISCLTKNIEDIKISSNSWRSFVDTLFTSVVYSKYAFWGFVNKMDCYKDSSDDFIANITGEFYKQQKKMLKNEKYIFKKGILKDSSTIMISYIKVAGEFWKLTDTVEINNIFPIQIYINLATYKFNYYYVFKKIDDSWKVPKKEIIALRYKFIKIGVNLKLRSRTRNK